MASGSEAIPNAQEPRLLRPRKDMESAQRRATRQIEPVAIDGRALEYTVLEGIERLAIEDELILCGEAIEGMHGQLLGWFSGSIPG